MSNAVLAKIDRWQLLKFFITVTALRHTNVFAAEVNDTDTSSSCSPLNCKASCTPNCKADEACVLRTMTECGTCPASVCVSRAVLGLPPLSTASVTDTTQSSRTTAQPISSSINSTTSSTRATPASASTSSNDTGPLIGGIVGGLIGFGLILALCIFFYLRHNKKRGRYGARKAGKGVGGGLLPFLKNGSHILASKEKIHHDQQQLQMQQEQQQQTPHPAVLAALSHQHRSSYSTFSIKKHLANSEKDGCGIDTGGERRMASTATGEALGRKVTLQNKRISEILNDNPRLRPLSMSEQQSQHHQLHQPVVLTDNNHSDNRHSVVSSMLSTDDESDFGGHQPQTAERQSTAYLHYQKASNMATTNTSNKAIQAAAVVTRAKPQIMRVNSVRSTTTTNSAGGGGLSRSGSVRTILTPCEPPTVGLLTRSASARTAATDQTERSINTERSQWLIGRSASVRSTATSYAASTLVHQPSISTASALSTDKPLTQKQLHRSVSVRSTPNELLLLSRNNSVHRTSDDMLNRDESNKNQQQNVSDDVKSGDAEGAMTESSASVKLSAKIAHASVDVNTINASFPTATVDSRTLTTNDDTITIENPFQDTQTSFKTADDELWSNNS